MRTLILGTIVTIALVAGATSFVVVDESEHAVITQLGRPTAVYKEAGIESKMPLPGPPSVKSQARRVRSHNAA